MCSRWSFSWLGQKVKDRPTLVYTRNVQFSYTRNDNWCNSWVKVGILNKILNVL